MVCGINITLNWNNLPGRARSNKVQICCWWILNKFYPLMAWEANCLCLMRAQLLGPGIWRMSFCPEGPFHKYWYFYRIFYLFVLIKHIYFPSVSQVWHCDQIFSCSSILLKANSIISDDILFYVMNCIQTLRKASSSRRTVRQQTLSGRSSLVSFVSF